MIHERIRQLTEVIERAGELRQKTRSSHDLMSPSLRSFVNNSHDFIEISRNVGNEDGESSTVGDVDVMEKNNGIGRKYKRNSELVASALAISPEVKRVDKEGMNFYDCNICLEMAEDPILTCCGHLFCWVCFYKLLPQDSTSKECPVCMGEVSDNSITPVYGNGNRRNASKTETSFEVPPRPKAQRIESGRQMRTAHGPSVPISESLHRISILFGTRGGPLPGIPAPENSNYNAAAQNAQIPLSTDGRHNQSRHQGLRVSSENSSSPSAQATALINVAEGIGDEIETSIVARPWQTRTSVSDRQTHRSLPSNNYDPLLDNNALVQAYNQSLNSTVGQLGNVVNRLPQQSSSSTRRRSQRLLDAGRSSSQSRRRLS